MPCFITSGAPVEQLSNGCIRSLDSFCSAHGYVDRHGGSWSWHLSSSSDATRSTKSSSSNKHGSMEKKKHSRKAPQPNDDSDEAFVPTVFLGDVFMPCNSLGLFRQHEDLDDLFGTSAHQAQPIPAKRTSQRIKSIASKQQPAQQPSPPQQQQQPAPASSLALDPASQLALRMATPIEGRRLFFVSNQSAEVIRQAQVIERYDEIMAKKAEQAAQSSAFPRPSDVREWMASLGSWMNPGSSPQGPSPFQDPTSSSGTSNSSSSSSSSSERLLPPVWHVGPNERVAAPHAQNISAVYIVQYQGGALHCGQTSSLHQRLSRHRRKQAGKPWAGPGASMSYVLAPPDKLRVLEAVTTRKICEAGIPLVSLHDRIIKSFPGSNE
uniref:GIY-YIG domain-containing protein n=1 Tax=Dunaliella tertiolecta TaxID=3047 RepID=A0A7S3R3F1_DUNTE